VSEYQYYDFKAIDRALTKAEMTALRSISTRAVITSTSFTNHYEWGDLKADPLKLLATYFDAFVYVANWGTREFHLRLPQELADAKQLKAMLPRKFAQVRSTGKFVTISFESEGEPDDDWDDGTGWMASLISLRADLLRGDFLCLYLGWLFCVQNGEFSGEALEPPVPAGLRELSAPHDSLNERPRRLRRGRSLRSEQQRQRERRQRKKPTEHSTWTNWQSGKKRSGNR